MNMLDTKKCFRGILFWREDVLKCAKVVKKPLSGFVRELLHTEMGKHRLSDEDNKILRMQIESAIEQRKSRKLTIPTKKGKRSKKHRVLTLDRIDIPSKVRKHPVFVKKGK